MVLPDRNAGMACSCVLSGGKTMGDAEGIKRIAGANGTEVVHLNHGGGT